MDENRHADPPFVSQAPPGPGLLFAVEGIDGSGKSTVVRNLETRFIGEGCLVRTTREPSEFETGRVVRARLMQPLSHALVDAEIDADYFLADRVYHNYALIKPLIRQGVNVISDRYDLGTIAYQSCQGLPLDYLLDRRRWLLDLGLVEKAAVHFVLDVGPEVALNRMESREEKTKFEDLSFLTRLRETYRSMPAILDDRIVFIDAEQTEQVVTDAIYREIGVVLRQGRGSSAGGV